MFPLRGQAIDHGSMALASLHTKSRGLLQSSILLHLKRIVCIMQKECADNILSTRARQFAQRCGLWPFVFSLQIVPESLNLQPPTATDERCVSSKSL
jgi:hypothetical protein